MSDVRTLFKRVDYELTALLSYIDMNDIGLPELQRPFVWTNAKVRDLFDSMYRGFPVGYLVFWSNADLTTVVRQVGVGDRGHAIPRLQIVDGQQRLTSLYAVIRGRSVVDSNYKEIEIRIAFRPSDGKFEVADAATQRDPEFIPSISELWTSGKSSRRMINEFIEVLKTHRSVLEEEEERVSNNLDRLVDIQRYPFTALEIAHTVDEERVADIFVRINSQGAKLNQADFILTLLSVFWEDGRRELERFSRESRVPPGLGGGPSPFNHFIYPAPDELLRVVVALGFNRGRLKSVYQVLRGKDPNTEIVSPELREAQFDRLRKSQPTVLDLTHWHQFFSALVGAGFRTRELISSDNAVLYSYAIYLIGKTRYRVPERILQKLMGRWFYAVTLSGRYTGSPETVMDGDLNRLKDLEGADGFVDVLERIIQNTLTRDFWSITLPNQLETSAGRSPELFAYHASQNSLGAPVLFSFKRISDLLDPTVAARKRALERHHLFPRAWLERNGVTDMKQINQVANLALLEWPENIDIGDDPPRDYVPKIRKRFDPATWAAMCRLHALPEGWEGLDYQEFLASRRRLMAEIIREGFQRVEEGTVEYVPPTQPLAGVDDTSEEADADEDSPASAERHALRLRFWSELLPRARSRSAVHANRSATTGQALAGGVGKRGLILNYLISPHRGAVELYIDRGKGSGSESKALFDRLLTERSAIDTEFGGGLDWQRLDGKRACRIRADIDTGGYRDLERWPEIQEAMIDAMVRLEKAVKPRIQELEL